MIVDDQIMTSSGGNIIIGTPGRIEQMVSIREFHTKELDVLILDEADRLLGESELFNIYGNMWDIIETRSTISKIDRRMIGFD